MFVYLSSRYSFLRPHYLCILDRQRGDVCVRVCVYVCVWTVSYHSIRRLTMYTSHRDAITMTRRTFGKSTLEQMSHKPVEMAPCAMRNVWPICKVLQSRGHPLYT
jgi:hypothetical protein